MRLITDYLFHPLAQIETRHAPIVTRLGLFIVWLTGFGFLSAWQVAGLRLTVMISFFLWLFYLCLILFQSILLDFIAQVFGYSAKSLPLFSWLAMSWLPLIFVQPLGHLSILFGPAGNLVSTLFSLGLVFAVFTLQLQTLRRLYGVGFLQAMVIYFFPFTFMLILFFVSGMVGFLFV